MNRPPLQINKVQECSEWLQAVGEQYMSTQAINWYLEHLGELIAWLPFINEQMAVAKYLIKEKKKAIYLEQFEKIKEIKSPSVIKDYVDAQLSNDYYAYDLCERTSRTIVHTEKALITTISALKAELQSVLGSRI